MPVLFALSIRDCSPLLSACMMVEHQKHLHFPGPHVRDRFRRKSNNTHVSELKKEEKGLVSQTCLRLAMYFSFYHILYSSLLFVRPLIGIYLTAALYFIALHCISTLITYLLLRSCLWNLSYAQIDLTTQTIPNGHKAPHLPVLYHGPPVWMKSTSIHQVFVLAAPQVVQCH